MPRRQSGTAFGRSDRNPALSLSSSRIVKAPMQRSSETIGTIAAALAKAQIELVNPEKLLTATIASPFPRENAHSFRYASLASGLDLIRKSLGRQEIATVQCTSIDSAAGIIRLTTTLAHSSGEWLASDWPVCPISETISPHRMGAALTYARRYALFALVGIAGEDDMDAPDIAQPNVGLGTRNSSPQSTSSALTNETSKLAANHSKEHRVSPSMLSAKESNAELERMIAELATTTSGQLAAWARKTLPAKATLTADDAKKLELEFTVRLAADPLESADIVRLPDKVSDISLASRGAISEPYDNERTMQAGRIDKSLLTISEPKRYRHKAHLKFVASRPCLLCGREPSDPHHLRFAQARALGRKVSDEFVVPLCRSHHRELHRGGNEKAWWGNVGIDPLPAAAALWARTRALPQSDGQIDAIHRPPRELKRNTETRPGIVGLRNDEHQTDRS